MLGFIYLRAIFFLLALIAIPDAGESKTWLQRVLRAAGYSLAFCIIAVIAVKLFGLDGGESNIEYRR